MCKMEQIVIQRENFLIQSAPPTDHVYKIKE